MKPMHYADFASRWVCSPAEVEALSRALQRVVDDAAAACDDEVYALLGAAYRIQKRYQESDVVLSVGARYHPTSTKVKAELAALNMDRRQWESAEALWKSIWQSSGGDLSPLNVVRYAKCLEILGDWPKYHEVLSVAAHADPVDESLAYCLLFSKGVIERMAGRAERTAAFKEKLLESNPPLQWPPDLAHMEVPASPHPVETLEFVVDVLNAVDSCGLEEFRSTLPERNWTSTKIFFAWLRYTLSLNSVERSRAAMRSLRWLSSWAAVSKELAANLNWVTSPSDLTPLQKLMIRAEIEGAASPVWVKYGCDLARRSGEQGDLEGLRVLCAPHRNIATRRAGLATREVSKFQSGFAAIAQHAQGIIRRGDFRLPASTTSTRHGRLRVVFVAAVLPAIDASTHLNTVYHMFHAFQGSEEVDLFFAMSGEDAVDTPWGPMGIFNAKQVEFHRSRWVDAGFPAARLYNGCDVSAEVRHDVTSGFFSWLAALAPDLVVFVGDLFESRAFRHLTFARYPTAYFPMSVRNDPGSSIDGMFVYNDAHYSRMVQKYGSERIVLVKYPVRVFQNDLDYAGPSLRRGDEDVVIATPLHNHRLEKAFAACSVEEIRAISEVFQRCPQLIWVLVGDSDFKHILEQWPELRRLASEGRLIHLSYIRELRGFFRTIDGVFVMPQMTGGHQGVCAAMYEGVPVLAWDQSDSAGILPTDAIYSSPLECSAKLLRLAEDARFRAMLGNQCRAITEDLSPRRVAARWVGELRKFSQAGMKRIRSNVEE